MKIFTNLWSAIGFRYLVILIFAVISWIVFQFIFEEITKIHMGIAAIIAIILSPRIKTIKSQNQTTYHMKWWAFKFIKI